MRSAMPGGAEALGIATFAQDDSKRLEIRSHAGADFDDRPFEPYHYPPGRLYGFLLWR